jgi:hypothetical protein
MPLILNIHTPAQSYALPYRREFSLPFQPRFSQPQPQRCSSLTLFPSLPCLVEDESSSALISRILRKSGLDKQAQETLKSASSSSGQSSGSLQYEYEGGRWLLSDGELR